MTLSPTPFPIPWGMLQLALLGSIALAGLLLLAVVAGLILSRQKAATTRRAPPAAPPPPGGAWLQVRRGPGAGVKYPLAYPTTVLGSDPQAHITITHPQIAPRHAALARERGRLVLRDLGSPSGTFVNGRRVSGAMWVSPGDVISLGSAVELILQGGR